MQSLRFPQRDNLDQIILTGQDHDFPARLRTAGVLDQVVEKGLAPDTPGLLSLLAPFGARLRDFAVEPVLPPSREIA